MRGPGESAGRDDGDRGSSPYGTGGGGVTFGQLVASVYLASMLAGSRRPEISELPVRSVAFQIGPEHPVDDLLVTCADDDTQVTLAIACRATPDFVKSDEQTVKLVKSLLGEVAAFDSDDHQVAVAALGWRQQWQDLAKLCDIARVHADQFSFDASIGVDGRWTKEVRDRFDQFKKMVTSALEDPVTDDEVLRSAWQLLARLHVLGFKVQSPDESDRTTVANVLDAVAAAPADGVAVRDRLESVVAGYDNKGGVVDLNLLRRDLHPLLDVEATRSRNAWQVLAEQRESALAAVHDTVGDSSGGQVSISFSGRRSRLIDAVRDAGAKGTALVVSGESGVGKSALTLAAVAELEAADPGQFEAVVVNLRSLPSSTLELRNALGMSFKAVLAETAAPSRVLVIDAADASFEGLDAVLSSLVLAAKAAGLGLVAVSSDVATDFVKDQLSAFPDVVPFTMEPLDDDEVAVVAQALPLLRAVLGDLPARSLMRRLVVLDLLARTGVAPSGSLGEWECLELIWSKVVRRERRPGGGSAEARERTLLLLAADAMRLPPGLRPAGDVAASAVDALRNDNLLAPPNAYQVEAQFAHDEVRRYATAILLVRATDQTALLEASPVPRLALSAATLACKGALKAPGVDAKKRFLDLLDHFTTFAAAHGARWADVPVEAVLETPAAYDALTAALNDHPGELDLDDVVRVVRQRHKFGALLNPDVAGEVVRILLDEDKPWQVSEDSFELLADWLTALVLADEPAQHRLRIALRQRLLAYWNSFGPATSNAQGDTRGRGAPSAMADLGSRRRRRQDLDYHQTKEPLVETMALLGPDIDDDIEACLRAIADDAPAFLAPAVDSPVSARAVAQREPELLAELMEAYYINDEERGYHDEGVRDHQGRWIRGGFGGPFFIYYFGGFWQLFQSAPATTQVRVLNNILNSGANARVRTAAGLGLDLSDEPQAPTREDDDDKQDSRGAVLNLDGTARLYVGDAHVWSWYRGTTVGPYSAMSGLQAMERVADAWLTAGASPRLVVELLLRGCANLAIPGMLFGLLVRHLEKVDYELDAFLAEPFVWQLEFSRHTSEYVGFAARTEGLENLDRRQWTPREVAAILIAGNGPERAAQLKRVGQKLVENGDRLGISQELTKNWAASLDAERYTLTEVDGGIRIEVEPPAELQAAQETHAAYRALVQTSLRLQNRYWGSATFDETYAAPTAEEIRSDLVAARELLDTDADMLPSQPRDAVAHVIRAAVDHAVAGDLSAFGDEATFATAFVLEVASAFGETNQSQEGIAFDLGADRAVARTLPAYLTEQLAQVLASAGSDPAQIADAGLKMAANASGETQLYLARGCDVIWSAPCAGDPCPHRIALDWLLETARRAELGGWDPHGHGRLPVRIDGDVAKRLQGLPGDSISISPLDAVIRGLGVAAATTHCCTEEAAALLTALLQVQGRAMVAHKENGWTADHQGSHTLIAARALLQGFADDGDAAPVLAHIDTLRAESSLLVNILHGLAAAGAENDVLASAARALWPEIVTHALAYAGDGAESPYRDHSWGDWCAEALLPAPVTWSRSLHNECVGPPLDWVHAEDLLQFIDGWLPIARGEQRCVDGLITFLRRLTQATQALQGLAWVSELCIQDGTVMVNRSWFINDWLKEIRGVAEELDVLDAWQVLVDSLVVAGNEGLAPYSR